MNFIKRKPFLFITLIAVLVIVLPLTIFFLQSRQLTRSHADKTVVLSLEPSSSQSAQLQIPAGATFSLDVYVDPGASSVSFVKTEIVYDAAKFEVAGGFIPNQQVFSQVVQGPSNVPGNMTTSLSIGSDTSKALTTKTKVGTVVLKALSTVAANSTGTISFGPNSQALAISTNSSFNENVIANTIPAVVQFNKPKLTCGTTPSDVMLIIDKSGSMSNQAGTSGTKISNAISAANKFIDILAPEVKNAIGLGVFDNAGTLSSPLTSTFASVKAQVNAITTGSGTCIQCGINVANKEITAHKRPGMKNVVILLTDGLANRIEGGTSTATTAVAEKAALDAAAAGHSTNGTIYYTIGLGTDVNSTFLTKLAQSSGGQYYFSPTTDQLNGIYEQISQLLANGSIGGVVFNDANGNATFDANESTLPGWVLRLSGSGDQTITSDSTGKYTFPNLCDGTYTVTQLSQSGWKQTLPRLNQGYPVKIVNGVPATDNNFGNAKATRCSDGIDNDGNGFTDDKDATCHTDGNPANPNSYDPTKDGENGSNTCSDSKDNNGNGLIDGADPICHTGGDPKNPWDPNLPEGVSQSTLTCSPNVITLTDTGAPLAVNLKTISGTPLSGKTVTWSSSNSALLVAPATSTSDATGKATSSATVAANTATAFSTTISAKFAGDANNTSAACVVQANYKPVAQKVTIAIDVLMHGIGNSGDNANPTGFSLSNKNPLTPKRNASVAIYDASNNLASTASGTISYLSSSGSFGATMTTNSPIMPGKYTIKISSDYHLTRLVPGILTLVVGKTNQIPSVHLVAGDANIDNRLDIRDYNMLLDCYSDLSPAIACNPQKKIATDANDDNAVNQFDYNLFLREISTQPGE